MFTGIALSQEKIELKKDFQSKSIINVAGVEFESQEGSINWTIGDATMILVTEDEDSSSDFEDDVRFSTYPNPSVESLHILCNSIENDPYTVTFYDLFGRVALTRMLYDKHSEINVQKLPAALYAAVIANPGGQMVKSFKLIKR